MATYAVNISGTFNQTYGYLTINGTKITTAGTRTYSSKPTISVYISSSQSNLRSKCEVTINDTVVKSGHGEYTLSTDATTINIVMLQVQDSSTYLYYCADIGIETPKTNEPHNTNIGGTAREIESGTVLLGGVLREIESGLVLVNGVAREIEFARPEMVTLTLSNALTSMERVVVNGQSYTAAGSYEIEKNSTVQVSVKGSSSSSTSVIRLNRTVVVSNRSTSFEVYELVADTAITIQSNGDSYRGYIDITK